MYTISLKAYVDIPTADISTLDRIRVYLKNTTTGDLKQKTLKFTTGQQWEAFSFVFAIGDLPVGGFLEGGYDQMYIGYGNGQRSTAAITYYVDQIYGSVEQKPLVNVLKGSWGGRLYVRGGENLDQYVAPLAEGGRAYDYITGAQEMANNYPTMGHVITNATNNANSQLWTLRTNPNVDAVMGAPNSIIDEEFVPSLANEQIIIDVINTLKGGGKKVILYLNTLSPGERATDEGAIAWNNYVDTYFAGDGHAAWVNYCEGYIKRFTELGIDGYWLDAFGSYNDNKSLGSADVESTTVQKAEFVQMIRNAAPNATITTNIDKDSFVDEDGKLVKVASDGVDDIDDRDYSIIKMTATNPWSDFTAGHITPLAQGAPPNSWAYEEFTVTDIEESPVSTYEGRKQTLKHLFLPIRATWSSERSDLLFDGEQAYRFAKRITDAGGSVTFSNTTSTDGTTPDDEVAILEFVNQQFELNADATVYERPLGAFLVGEIQEFTWTGEGSDNSWSNPSNWENDVLPIAAADIFIPVIANGNYPTANNEIIVNTITMAAGTTFIPKATVTGNITYTRNLDTTDWYLVSSSVTGETIEDLLSDIDTNIATGTNGNLGFGTYNNMNNTIAWDYATLSSMDGILNDGQGYGLKLIAPGNVNFTGKVNTTDVDIAVSDGVVDNFSLLGNPYLANLDSSSFLTENDSGIDGVLSEQTLWFSNGSGYKTTNLADNATLVPGDGFFIETNGSGTITFKHNDLKHASLPSLAPKNTTVASKFKLSVASGNKIFKTKIFFIADKTTGFDNGYDSKMFGGTTYDFAVYTELVNENEGNKLAIQTLPDTFDAVIPVGIIGKASQEVIFSIEDLSMPENIDVYLEDKLKGEFTNLSETTYKTTLTEDTDSTGQFYLHTRVAKVLSTEEELINNNISIYKSFDQKLKVTGLNTTGNITIYSLLGKEVFNSSIEATENYTVNLPNLSKGIYVVTLNSEYGIITKKITL